MIVTKTETIPIPEEQWVELMFMETRTLVVSHGSSCNSVSAEMWFNEGDIIKVYPEPPPSRVDARNCWRMVESSNPAHKNWWIGGWHNFGSVAEGTHYDEVLVLKKNKIEVNK